MRNFQLLHTSHADFSPFPISQQPILQEVLQMLRDIVPITRLEHLPELSVRLVGHLVTCYVTENFGSLSLYPEPFAAAVVDHLRDQRREETADRALVQIAEWRAIGVSGAALPGEYGELGRIIAFFNVDDEMQDHVLVSVTVYREDAGFRMDKSQLVASWAGRYNLDRKDLPGYFTDMGRELEIMLNESRQETARIRQETVRIHEAAQHLLEEEAANQLITRTIVFPASARDGEC